MIRRLARISTIPWCILGDFNDLMYDSDKRGVHPHPLPLLEGFGKAVEDSLLT